MKQAHEGPRRRTVVKAAAWSIPALAIAVATPGAAASTTAFVTITFTCPSITRGGPFNDTASGGSVTFTAIGDLPGVFPIIQWDPASATTSDQIPTPSGATRSFSGSSSQIFSLPSLADGESVVIELPVVAAGTTWQAVFQVVANPDSAVAAETLTSSGVANTAFGQLTVGLC